METRRKLEQILEDDERTEQKKEDLIRMAERIAHNFLMMSITRQEAEREQMQIERIAEQVLKTVEVQQREFHEAQRLISMEKLLSHLIIAELHGQEVGAAAQTILHELGEQQIILSDIKFLIRSREPKLRQLEALIHNLLEIIHLTHQQMQAQRKVIGRAA